MTPHERETMIEGAKRYAKANKSDPFAMRRALTHINSGAASFRVARGRGKALPGYYDAEPVVEHKKAVRSDGTVLEWDTQGFRNLVSA